jgi:hypothetical protein
VNQKSLSTAEIYRHQAGFKVKPVAHDPLMVKPGRQFEFIFMILGILKA